MILDWESGVFIFKCTFEERNVPKEARFWWNSSKKRWETKSMRCALRLRRYATLEAKDRIRIDRQSVRPVAGHHLSHIQDIAHRTHTPRETPEYHPAPERLPIRDLEGLPALYEKYRDSIQAGHQFQKTLGE